MKLEGMNLVHAIALGVKAQGIVRCSEEMGGKASGVESYSCTPLLTPFGVS